MKYDADNKSSYVSSHCHQSGLILGAFASVKCKMCVLILWNKYIKHTHTDTHCSYFTGVRRVQNRLFPTWSARDNNMLLFRVTIWSHEPTSLLSSTLFYPKKHSRLCVHAPHVADNVRLCFISHEKRTKTTEVQQFKGAYFDDFTVSCGSADMLG